MDEFFLSRIVKKLNSLLVKEDARIVNSSGDTWLTADLGQAEQTKYSVYYRRRHMHNTQTLYEGYNLADALSYLETE